MNSGCEKIEKQNLGKRKSRHSVEPQHSSPKKRWMLPLGMAQKNRTGRILGDYDDRFRQILRFSVSKVAQLTGFTHFPRGPEALVEMFLELLFQDLQHVLLQDAALLELRLISHEENMNQIISHLSAEAQKQVAVVRNADLLATEDVSKMSKRISGIISQEAKKGNISLASADDLLSSISYEINTSFGLRHEEAAIIQWNKENPGWSVCECNEEKFVWTFLLDANGSGEFAAVIRRSVHPNRQNCCSEGGNQRVKSKSTSASENDMLGNPLFSIVGMVDGIAYWKKERSLPQPEDDTAKLLEIKTRVSGFKMPVPFYEQLQCVCYMMMLGYQSCDLVQSIRRKHRPISSDSRNAAKRHVGSPAEGRLGAKRTDTEGGKCVNARRQRKSLLDFGFTRGGDVSLTGLKAKRVTNTNSRDGAPSVAQSIANDLGKGRHIELNSSCDVQKQERAAPVDIEIRSSSVRLNEMHEKGFRDTIVPRLRSIAEFIYELRMDDSKRYSFMTATSEEQAGRICAKLPFLAHLV